MSNIVVINEKIKIENLESCNLGDMLTEIDVTYGDFTNYFYNPCQIYDECFDDDRVYDYLVDEGLLPPMFKKLNLLMDCDGDVIIFYWQGLGIHKSEVMLFELMDHEFTIISNSINNFLCRGLEHKSLDLYLEDEEEELNQKIIEKYEEKPIMQKYNLAEMEKWPKHWQEFLTEEDYNFGNDDD